jgi:hypothetical protein
VCVCIVIRHFGVDPLLDVELHHVPAPVVDQVLAKDIKAENNYLNQDEKTVLKHFGVDPLTVELERVPPKVVDAELVKQIEAEQQRTREQLQQQQQVQLPVYAVDTPVVQTPVNVDAPIVDAPIVHTPVYVAPVDAPVYPVDQAPEDVDQVRLLNEFRRVRGPTEWLY